VFVVNDVLRRGMRAIIDELDMILTRTVVQSRTASEGRRAARVASNIALQQISEFLSLQCDFTIVVVTVILNEIVKPQFSRCSDMRYCRDAWPRGR
jgi:3-deoxy-D-manno-octulosonic acid (KDO) 8-phosphate synthase